MIVVLAMGLALLQSGESPPVTGNAGDAFERASEVRRLFRDYYLAGSVDRRGDRQAGALAHGAFYNDPNRCIELFSEQFEAVELEGYFVETVYSGASLGYYFYTASQIHSFFDDTDRTLPAGPAFRCVRHADWGDVLLVEPME